MNNMSFSERDKTLSSVTLTLRYRRLGVKVGDDFPYQGQFELFNAGLGEDCILFDSLPFKDIVSRLHEILIANPVLTRVVFKRDDHEGILPMELGNDAISLLRADPVGAYRAMTFKNPSSLTVLGTAESNKFSRYVYVRVRGGNVEDPITGTSCCLAYGDKYGWKIRGTTNRPEEWLPISTLIDDAPEGVSSIERLVFIHWALIDVEDLLKTSHDRFFLPRSWNPEGAWIAKESLQRMYEKSKESVS